MANAKLGPSSLNHLLEEIENWDLPYTKRETLKALINAELERRTDGSRLPEFHSWIKQGDAILNEVEAELERLHNATSEDGDLVSLASVLEVVDALFSSGNGDPTYDKGRDWALAKVIEGVKNLPTVKRADTTDE